jgi:hypothetical protein
MSSISTPPLKARAMSSSRERDSPLKMASFDVVFDRNHGLRFRNFGS